MQRLLRPHVCAIGCPQHGRLACIQWLRCLPCSLAAGITDTKCLALPVRVREGMVTRRRYGHCGGWRASLLPLGSSTGQPGTSRLVTLPACSVPGPVCTAALGLPHAGRSSMVILANVTPGAGSQLHRHSRGEDVCNFVEDALPLLTQLALHSTVYRLAGSVPAAPCLMSKVLGSCLRFQPTFQNATVACTKCRAQSMM